MATGDEGLTAPVENEAVEVESFASEGHSIASVPVHISYGIIERFSEGLYSSPNKTFEELVTNSYDAGAGRVWVYLPNDFEAPGATLVVIDDGQSMDLDGLKNLWRIGESLKRTDQKPAGRARPVGKFGIGKLATYVLAQRLTYIVHPGDNYLAVTMDYGRVAEGHELMAGTSLALEVVELTKEQAHQAIRDSMTSAQYDGDHSLAEQALAGLGEGPWTAAILTRLKKTAKQISLGRLRWVLSTALPLNPGFSLWLNDTHIASSKAGAEPSWTFTVGQDENTLSTKDDRPWGPGEKTKVKVGVEQPGEKGQQPTLVEKDIPALRLPNAGVVYGTAFMYNEPLERGKSEYLGRSHGFFVRVRGRLINLNSEDFEVGPELRHGTLTRFRMEINADDLDDKVASARETLKESPALDELKNYLLAVFNKARGVSSEQDADDAITRLSKQGRLSSPPPGLSQGPLRRMLQRAAAGDRSVQAALGIDDATDLDAATQALADDKDLVESVLLETSSADKPFVIYDPARRAAVLNQSHPFVANYIGTKAIAEPLKLLGLTEILVQAYLLDENVAPDAVARVVKRRDGFLRALTNRYPRSAHVIAQALRDATNNENALEDAVGDSLELLGFEVQRFGGASHGVDGIATARLGWRADGDSSISYAMTYDAKSTANAKKKLTEDENGTPIVLDPPGKIRADTARTSVLKVHRQRALKEHDLKVEPEFTLLVAPDYQGANDDLGLINAVCINDGITAIRVSDLAKLVELFALQGFTPADMRNLFQLHTPEETRSWVAEREQMARVPAPPVAVLVQTSVKFSESKRPASRDALGAWLDAEGVELTPSEVDALIRGLAALAPRSVFADDRIVALNASPAALYAEIRASLDEFDPSLVDEYRDTVPDQDA